MHKHLTLVTLMAAGLSLGLAAPCKAQTLQFEPIGGHPIDAKDLQFDQQGTLWASTAELYKLLLGANSWEEVNGSSGGFGQQLLILSPDTVLLTHQSAVHRSVDGGNTFSWVHTEGNELYSALLEGPNDGVILAGEASGGSGIAYSTDRGATFTEATFTVSTNTRPQLETAVEIPDGPAAGRLVAGVFAGVVISEDGGQTWEPSSLFQDARYWVQHMEIGLHPATGERRLYLSMADAQEPDVQYYYSDDDGLTWINAPPAPDAFLFVSVPPAGGLLFGETGALLAVERGTALEGDSIEVWRSTDGAQTWSKAGRLPAEPGGNLITTDDILIGPDGHVYVAVERSGPARGWVYRTTEPVVVANEAPPEMPTEETRLRIYPNPAASHITIQTSAEAVEILDVLGRVVLRAGTGGRIDISNLPVGVYLVQAGSQLQRFTVLR